MNFTKEMFLVRKFLSLISVIGLLGIIIGCSGNTNLDTDISKKLPAADSTASDDSTLSEDPEPVQIETNYDNIYLPEWARWDMDINELKDTEIRAEKRELGSGNVKYYAVEPVNTDYFNYNFDYVYIFENEKLKTYFIEYSGDYNFLEKYNEMKNAVIERYGEPLTDTVVWTDETYKNDEEKFNQAFKYGYVTMNCRWVAGDNVILLKWDYKNTMYLAYCHKSYESKL